MAYIWKNYSSARRFSFSAGPVSPYIEAWESGGEAMLVNRSFTRIFDLLYPPEAIKAVGGSNAFIELIAQLQDSPADEERSGLILHALAQIDRTRSLGRHDMEVLLELDEISSGAYGAQAAAWFQALSPRQQYEILHCMVDYRRNGQRQPMFLEALRRCFEGPRIYYEERTKLVHIYIPEEQNAENEAVYALIEFLFLDMGTQTQIMWRGQHFGVIGWDDTMAAGQTALI